MSTMMRPSGPLPSRVYWTRRLVALALLSMLVLATWWLVAPNRSDGSPDAAADLSTGPTPAAEEDHGGNAAVTPRTAHPGGHDRPTASGPAQPTSPREGSESLSTRPHAKSKNKPGNNPAPTTLEAPSGNCDPAQVDMSIDVADSIEGRSNTATFIFQLPPGAAACRLAITPDTLVTRVTSGSDVVWSSGDCPDTLLAKEVVVRSDPATVYEFQWNGRRSTDACRGSGTVAPPGGYWVEAALVGGEPQKAFFDITEPRSARR